MHMDMSQDACWARIIYRKKPRTKIATHSLREPAVETHVDMSQEAFWARIYRKKAGDQDRDAQFVRSRNADGHVTRVISIENLREKCRGADGAPWSNRSLNTYRKNPSVWTHCLGQKCVQMVLHQCFFQTTEIYDKWNPVGQRSLRKHSAPFVQSRIRCSTYSLLVERSVLFKKFRTSLQRQNWNIFAILRLLWLKGKTKRDVFKWVQSFQHVWQSLDTIYFDRRKFRSQTSDNMDKWKAKMGRVREEKRREEERRSKRESLRRKKIQVRGKVGKSRNTVFFPMICGSGGSKSSKNDKWEMQKLHTVVARSSLSKSKV